MAIRFEISSSLLPDHATVAAFHGSEGISRPYVFDVYVVVTGGADVDVDEAPGAKVTLTIDGGDSPAVHYSGMIATMELLRAVHVDGQFAHENSLYLVRIVPHLWQLSLTKHSRIWTKKSLPDIIKDVLDEEGVSDYELRLQSSYDTEEHVCQYKESSLNFIQRWMEREGMYYFFEQSDSGEKLIVTDNKSTSSPSRVKPIPYHTGGSADGMAGAHLDLFTWRNSATPATVRFTDYDYGKPALDVVGKASVSKLGIGEQVTYGNRFFTPSQGDALATVRAEDFRAQAKTFHGSGPVIGIVSGYQFLVEGHPKLQLNVEYLAVNVEHFGYLHGVGNSWGKSIPHDHTDTYRVDVMAIVATQQYRHPETAVWPRLDGFENAIVDGPITSEYAQIDDAGRYNVKFKFDEGTLKGGKASTWVRKMQPHAGTVEGWHFPERSGTEVVCAFLGGDPDRPIIVGAVPTAIHPSPVNKNNHTKNVIQTGGKNRYEMEDQSGQQRVTISTPHQKTFLHMGFPLSGLSQVFTGEGDEGGGGGGGTEGPMCIQVPDHHSAIVTDGNNLIKTCGNQDVDAGGNWHVSIAQNHVEHIGANRVDTVDGYMEQSITGKLDQDVHGPVTEEYHDIYEQDVQGEVTYKHMAKQTMTVAEETIWHTGTKAEWTVGTDAEWKIGGKLDINVTGPHEIKSATWHETTWGAKSEFIGGWKNEEVLGLCTEAFVGPLKFEMVAGGSIEVKVGVFLEIEAAAKFEMTPLKNGLHIEKVQESANHSDLIALKNAVVAMNSVTSAVANATYGARIHRQGISSKMGAMDNEMVAVKAIE